ncbi:MAG TPA: patatin-like phospholipase family protein [Gemmatimonadaceae bacterium]|nr:patatin-like phospholipase family protein [Gemmatimonadaceae bacterium]
MASSSITSTVDAAGVAPAPTPDCGDLALVLTGGGARGAYQVGVLSYLAERFPGLRIPIITGVSAGAVNASQLAQHRGTFPEAVQDLVRLWATLTPGHVFRVDARSMYSKVARWGLRLMLGGRGRTFWPRGLVDTEPLRAFLRAAMRPENGVLTGIEHNLARGTLRAVALSTTSYTTGQNVIWVQGREIVTWERPNRRSVHARLGVEHVMASSALPLFFPAVRLGDAWYGDGGIRMSAPLSPALHLGAHKLLALSTRYARSEDEAARPSVVGYPPPAQVLGVLHNAIFLDVIDQDVIRLQRLNRVLRKLPPDEREGMRVVEMLVIRPSRDLGRLAARFEPRLPGALRFLTRGLGTRETSSPDLLSLLLFQDDYVGALMETGYEDARAQGEQLEQFLFGNALAAR